MDVREPQISTSLNRVVEREVWGKRQEVTKLSQ
jgi:hypothetical protein